MNGCINIFVHHFHDHINNVFVIRGKEKGEGKKDKQNIVRDRNNARFFLDITGNDNGTYAEDYVFHSLININ